MVEHYLQMKAYLKKNVEAEKFVESKSGTKELRLSNVNYYEEGACTSLQDPTARGNKNFQECKHMQSSIH